MTTTNQQVSETLPVNVERMPQVPMISAQSIKERAANIQQIIDDVMEEGYHYGPAYKGSSKKVLLKPGAETLQMTFQLDIEYTIETDKMGPHREHTVHAIVYHYPTGQRLGSGVGSCSTLESKYRWRKKGKTCPECKKEGAIIKGKQEYGGGWLCFNKKGGCGAKFKDGDKEIEGQSEGRIENPDIADEYNTVLKMGKKRAMIDAVLNVTGVSYLFTQDLDEQPDYRTQIEQGNNGNNAPNQQSQPQNRQSGKRPNNKSANKKQPTEIDKIKKQLEKLAYEIDDPGKRSNILKYIKKASKKEKLSELGNKLALYKQIKEKLIDLSKNNQISNGDLETYWDAMEQCTTVKDYEDLKDLIKEELLNSNDESEPESESVPAHRKKRTGKQTRSAVDEAVNTTASYASDEDIPDPDKHKEYENDQDLPFK